MLSYLCHGALTVEPRRRAELIRLRRRVEALQAANLLLCQDKEALQQELKMVAEQRMQERQAQLEYHESETRRLMGLPKHSPWKSQRCSEKDWCLDE